jgi:hypothetical protein
MDVRLENLNFVCPVGGRWIDASNLILANKDLIANEAVERMLLNNQGFVIPGGNQECVDDVLKIIDALAFNIRNGGNNKIYEAAEIYVTQPYLLEGERNQSLEVYNEVAYLATQAMRNELITIEGSHGLIQTVDNEVIIDDEIPYCADVASAIYSLINIITDAIGIEQTPGTLNGIVKNIPEKSGRWIDASNLIKANKNLIANEAVERMLLNNVGFVIPNGNQECIDDVLKIIDALTYNLQYGGNNKIYEAAEIYVTQPNLLDGERDESVEVYNEVVSLSIQAMRNELITIQGSHGLTQLLDNTVIVDTGTPICDDVASAISSLMGIITNAIGSEATPGNLDGIINITPEKSGRWIDASNLILANKNLIANEAVERMLFNNQGFVIPGGNQECIDDVLKIIDALSYNVQYGGNNKIYEAAEIYVTQPNLLNGERNQSVEVYTEVISLSIQAMRNEPITIEGSHGLSQFIDSTVIVDDQIPYCADVASAIDSLMNIIIDSIGTETRSGSIDGVIKNSPSKGGRWTDAYNLITRNKDFLASEAVDRMLANNVGFTIPNGNQECIDDALLIIEALAYNVKYGGNRKIYDAARIYVDQPNLLDGERDQASEVYSYIKDLAIQVIRNESITVEGSHGLFQFIDNTITLDTETPYCSDVASAVSTLMDIIITAIGTEANPGSLDGIERNIISDLTFPSGNFGFVFTVRDVISPTEFTLNVGPSRFVHEYVSGGYIKIDNVRPFDGQILYFDDLYYEVSEVIITNPGKGYTSAPNIQIGPQLQPWGINAEAVAEISNGSITETNVVSSGRGYTNVSPFIIIDPPDDPDGVSATAEVRLRPSYLIVESSKEITETKNIQTAVYDETTGLLTAITNEDHNLNVGDTVRLEDLLFSCSHVPKSGRWIDASNLILANKDLIANEAVERMLINNVGFSVPGGNQECIDDVLKFINAIAFNIKYGGNNRVYDAAALYVSQPNLLNGERDQSVEVYNNVRDLAIQVIRNEPIIIQGDHEITQIIDNNVVVDTVVPACIDVADAITSLVFIITYSIGTEATPGNLNGILRSSGENSSLQYFPSGAYGYEFQVLSTPSPTVFEVNVGSSNIEHAYESGGTITIKDIYDVVLKNNVPYELNNSNIAYFYKQSRLLASSHAFQYIGSGTEITSALPQNEGVTIAANETVSINGGLVVYTSTDQSGNFKIGDGVIIDQSTGTISGEAYGRSLFATVTPFILALGG